MATSPASVLRLVATLLVLVLALPNVVGPARVRAQDENAARARAEFDRGVELFRAERWQEALSALQEAYRLRPHPVVRLNMANCYERLARPLEAIFHFERYLAEIGTNAPTGRRQEVEASLARLRATLGELVLQITPDGASVRIDDAEERRAPILEPVRLPAGRHEIAIRLDGYEAVTRTVDLAGGESATVAVSLERARVAAAPATATTTSTATTTAAEGATDSSTSGGEPEGVTVPLAAREPTQRRLDNADITEADIMAGVSTSAGAGDDGPSRAGVSTSFWVAGGATIAMVGGAIATGVLALSAEDDFEAHLARSNDLGASPEARAQAVADGERAADRADTLALVTDILTAGAVLGAVTTVVLYFTAGSPTGETQGSALRASPWVARGGAGLVIEGAL